MGATARVGLAIGRGATLAQAVAGLRDVAEGVTTARSVHDQALARGVEMPITREVYRVLYEGKDPRAAVSRADAPAPQGRDAVTSALPMPIPAACSVAFKEWAGICAALADGRQCLILRKGGIDEGAGPGNFRPEHDAFWLYPTFVHQAQQGLRVAAPEPPADVASAVPIVALAEVATIDRLTDPSLLPALEPFHVWTEETVLKRFHYRSPGLWVLAVRVHRLPQPWPLAVTAEHAGCKTWVELDAPPPTTGLTPALDDEAFARGFDAFRMALDPSRGWRGVGA